jgi:HK97 family phage major capsid protein
MAPSFSEFIDRSDTEALMPEDVSSEILKNVSEGSTVTRLARRLPNMTRSQRRMPILSVLPTVEFVGEAGRVLPTGHPQTFEEIKPTTKAEWGNKYIYAEEMAAIIAVPENVLDDSEYDVWAEIQPEIIAAIGAKIDYSVFFGVKGINVPAQWPNGIMMQMPSAHKIADSHGDDLYDAIMGVGGVISKVEEDGFFVNGHVARLGMRAKLRGLRSASDKLPLFVQDMKSATPYALDGARLEFPVNGSFEQLAADMISGDWTKLVWSMRKDITLKVLTEGVITDNSEPRQIIHNLAQDDMIGLRVTFRMGWELPNPINRVQQDESARFPFAALTPTGS